MRSRALLQFVAVSIFFILACHKDTAFDNPFDPASTNYIPPFAPSKGILIDDFDDGKDPNLLGFCPEVFKDSLRLADIMISYNNQPENVLRGVGYSIQIDFDVSQGGIPFGGYVQRLIGTGIDPCGSLQVPFNLADLNLDTLTFWVKTEFQRINFEVALKDSSNNQTDPKVLIRDYVIPDNRWRKVKIPFSVLLPAQKGGTVDLQRLREINFGFAKDRFQNVSAVLRGTIYLDEIAFER